MATKTLDMKTPSSPQKDIEARAVDYAQIYSPVKPSAPPVEWPITRDQAPTDTEAPLPFPAPELLPPSARAKRGLAWLTLKLVPYHVLSFALGTSAFCIVVTGVSLAGGLLPLCCLGVPIYFLLLHLTRLMVAMDIALANLITRPHATACWHAPDELDATSAIGFELRIAPGLTRVSVRSTLMLLYFGTIKFGLGILSAIVVCLPFLPLAAEIVELAGASDDSSVAGWNSHSFNFETHPVWYTLVFIAYVVGGVVLMHVVGWISRGTTRRLCCVEVEPTQSGATGPEQA